MSFELAEVYTAEYDEAVKEYFPPFPRGLAGRYYDEGLQYFKSFDGFGDNYDVLSVEDRFELDIRGNRFVGIADLILRDRNIGLITVIDHKSKSMACGAHGGLRHAQAPVCVEDVLPRSRHPL